MATVTFDTDELIQRLIAAKFEPEQARAIVRVMVDAQTELATKGDIAHLEARIKADMESLEYRMVIKLGSMSAASIAITAAVVKLLGH